MMSADEERATRREWRRRIETRARAAYWAMLPKCPRDGGVAGACDCLFETEETNR